jgi:hypothetical protein
MLYLYIPIFSVHLSVSRINGCVLRRSVITVGSKFTTLLDSGPYCDKILFKHRLLSAAVLKMHEFLSG